MQKEHIMANYLDDFFLLLEAGFIAVNDADEDSATKLFKASELLKPENSFPKIGFGYMHLCKLEIKKAISIFTEISEKEPNNEIAKSLLGICMSMSPSLGSNGKKLLEKTAKESKDSGVKALAEFGLTFIEQSTKNKTQEGPSSPKRPRT